MMNAVLSSSSLENEKTNMPHLYVTYQCYDIFYGMAIKIYIRPNINIRYNITNKTNYIPITKLYVI